MTNVKSNFKTMYSDISCEFCDKGEPQTDAHLLDCLYFIKHCPQLENNSIVEYEDIFMTMKTYLFTVYIPQSNTSNPC